MSIDDLADDDLPGDHALLIQDLLRQSARWLLADPDPHRFINRLVQEGPQRFAALLDGEHGLVQAEERVQQEQFFRSFGWAIASSMPLPEHGFAPRKLPLPGRNEACICGSQRKFKHCCASVFSHLPEFEPAGLGAVMLTEMPRARWPGLPAARVPPRMVLEAAALLSDEGQDRPACALLEPWAKQAAPWPGSQAPLFDLLCDLYLDLGHPRKRERLARDMVAKGDAVVQATGWRRLAMMAADANDQAAADDAFARAQRLCPDEPDLALLEVTLLLGRDEPERASERASFHARRLSRLPHAEALGDEIAMLEKLARGEFPHMADGFDDDDDVPGRPPRGGDLMDVLEPDSPFNALRRWADTLPPPQLRLQLNRATATDLGALAPATALAAPLGRWRKAFKLQMPTVTWGQLDADALQVFVDERWSALLRREPGLADCFEVLDGLVHVLDLVPLGLAAGLQATLLQRALALWSALRQSHPAARCEWVHLDNRPALRLLARRVELDTSPCADESFEWLQALVEVLNPHDNHGFRERLAAVYLRRGQPAQALALCERYPGDFVGMQLLHVRALLALQRLGDAAQAFQAALAANKHVAGLLQASRAPRPLREPSYAVGSVEQAKLAVGAQHDLWREPAVRRWLQARLQGGPHDGLFD